MFHFSPKEAEYFFGRDVFIEELFQATQTRNFIPVLGASGSGKSSVVLAGLVPKLVKAGHWQFTHFRPGKDPFLALAQSLVPLYRSDLDSTDTIIQARKLARSFSDDELPLSDVFATIHRNHPNQRILLIADQFEELYTLCRDDKTRRLFLDIISKTFQSSSAESSSSTVLVTTMRADFLGNVLSYPPLADVWRKVNVQIRSMNPEELREVIEKPAQKVGVSFEGGLVERILKDVDKEPGNLPLLEFALTELWKKRTSKQLTHQAYEEIGEVSGALTSYADREFSKLKPEEQERVRRIFIQLVRPGEGTEDTRRVATKVELKETNWKLVKRLADARLVVTSRTVVTSAKNAEQETVEVVHEALIRNWGQLKGWMETDREFRSWQERIRATMGHWQEMNRDKGLLLRGAALVQAQEKLKERGEELSQAEQEFIGLSEALQVREEKQKQRQRQTLIGGLVGFSVAISGLAATAFGLWRNAVINEQKANLRATIARLDSRLLSGEKSLDVQLDVIEKNQELQQAKKPTTDVLMQGTDLLRQTVSQRREINRLNGHRDLVHDVTFSRDGKYLASASGDKTVKLWTAEGQLVKTLRGHQDDVYHVTFSPDGKYLASASLDKTVKLWTAEGELVETLRGHQGEVYDVIFSRDGKYLASASSDKTVKLWTAEGELVETLSGHQHWVTDVTFSRDGKYLASASRDKTVKLWRQDGKLVATLSGHQGGVSAVTFSGDGKYLASASSDKTVKLWTREGKFLKTLTGHHSGVTDVIFSPDGKYLASASRDSTVKLWTREGKLLKTLTGNQAPLINVSFSPDGKYLASGSYDQTVKLWTREGELVDTLSGHQSSGYRFFYSPDGKDLTYVSGVIFSPDGKHLASSSLDKTVKLWTVEGDLVETLSGHHSGVTDVTFSRDGKYLASASRDKTVKLWTQEGKLLHTFTGHQSSVNHVTFSPDGQYLASSSLDNTVKLWTAEGELVETLRGHQLFVNHVIFSQDGKYLASASWDNTVKLWTAEGELVETLSGHQGSVNHVTFSPDGQYLASASSDNTVKLWTAEGELVETLRGHQDKVTDVIFSRDGKYLASASSDSTVKLWTAEGKLVDTLRGHQGEVTDVTLSRDGQYLASASYDKTVKLWTAEGELVETLRGHQGEVTDVTFSRDGKYLASASSDKTVKLWTAEGELVGTLRGHQGEVTDVTFSRDGQYLASASSDNTVKLWNFNRDELLKHACKGVNDYLKNNPDVSDKERSLCGVEASATVFLLQGDKLADNGKIDEAITKFKKALELDPSLEFDSHTRARKIAALFFVREGERLAEWNGKINEAISKFEKALELNPSLEFDSQTRARKLAAKFWVREGERLAALNGKINEAISKFEKALELDPSLEFDSQTRARKLAAKFFVSEGEELAAQGKVDEALSSYNKAQELDPNLEISANSWNALCWDGSLYNQADKVMFACEKAVELAPDEGYIQDSRGLARALTGNIKGAIEDFEVFITWTDNQKMKAQRQGWVDALKKGENPFTTEVLESLR
ncbi:WD40 repeat domain-containing protein [Moorena sp. SIO3I8]|uniref:nSTAND1 domain-containing NTPase n=1 Tax=Moorena sp. SIO3I8 TaxID=2607833 RepID=UPI0013BECC4B|nr:WD40 repeat domain-containing protein [Moorena sp. SIO3I8]NEO05953.1 hypothetical protein [Moorena sp. SIO3I8]